MYTEQLVMVFHQLSTEVVYQRKEDSVPKEVINLMSNQLTKSINLLSESMEVKMPKRIQNKDKKRSGKSN